MIVERHPHPPDAYLNGFVPAMLKPNGSKAEQRYIAIAARMGAQGLRPRRMAFGLFQRVLAEFRFCDAEPIAISEIRERT